MKNVIHLLIIILMSGCISEDQGKEKVHLPIDANATEETVALYQNLKDLSGEHVLFGHQDDLAYGFNWWDEPGRSDVMEVSGSYPAVYGWDLGNIAEKRKDNLDGINFKKMRTYIQEGYNRGGVITFSWHMLNPVTGGNSWDTVPTITQILPGKEHHQTYRDWLDIFAEFSTTLIGNDGELIPVIFRPFHEHNGDWFWWGKGINDEEDYIALWRFTVEYLRDEKQVHNLLWAFSPDRSRTNIENFKKDYFYGYPGDDYVDIIGLDNYWDVGHPANETDPDIQQEHFIQSLTYTAQIADSLNKIAALTETGIETIPDPESWSNIYLAALKANPWTERIVYMLTWRNANLERMGREHFYAPYSGHASSEDFISFKNSEFILFEDEVPDLYEIKAKQDR